MTDGLGTANYAYDTVSRLTSESRTLTGLSGSFAIGYEYYQVTGQLKKITDPFGDSVSYAYDLTGRTTAITGSSFAGVTSYVSAVTFRAGNQTKSLTSGTTTATMGYDSMLRVNTFQSSGATTLNYGYYSDNRLYQVTAPNNHLYDRYFDYNNPIGSLNYTSANGDTSANQYYLTMSHDYLGNQTSRGGRYWWMATGTTFSNSTQFTNNKIISGSDSGSVTTSFDNEGNTLGLSQGSTQTLGPDKFDVAGRIVAEVDPAVSKYYDGDGNLVRNYNEYYLFSKVLGGKQLSIISATGTKTETSVFGNGQLLARQEIIAGVGQVTFVHRDPNNTIDYSGNETQWVDAQGTTGKAATSTYISQYQAGMFGHPDPSTYVTNTGQFYPGGGGNQKPGQSTVCYENYVKVSCSSLNNSIRMGGIVWMRVSSQSLTGYDEDSSNLLSSANSSATLRDGKPTGAHGARVSKKVVPGIAGTGDTAAYGLNYIFEDGSKIVTPVEFEQFEPPDMGGMTALVEKDNKPVMVKPISANPQSLIDKAAEGALSILLNNKTCRDALGIGEKDQNALNVLAGIYKTGRIYTKHFWLEGITAETQFEYSGFGSPYINVSIENFINHGGDTWTFGHPNGGLQASLLWMVRYL